MKTSKQQVKEPSDLWIYALLTVAIFAAYGAVLRFGFVNYDDPVYIAGNPNVSGGITWSGIVWAFTHSFAGNWFPLTWISHMLDCQIFGLDAGGITSPTSRSIARRPCCCSRCCDVSRRRGGRALL